MQSLGAIAHYDYNQPASYSYEQAIQVIRRLVLPREDLDQQVLRAMFNVVVRNHDDHVKNIAFLMNRRGKWRLSPAFDISYAWAPKGEWTSRHQMSVNGKRDEFEREDLIALANVAGIKKARANEMVDRAIETVRRWPDFAEKAGVADARAAEIQTNQRTNL
jgi:serine/threonine-protein kinase HipA